MSTQRQHAISIRARIATNEGLVQEVASNAVRYVSDERMAHIIRAASQMNFTGLMAEVLALRDESIDRIAAELEEADAWQAEKEQVKADVLAQIMTGSKRVDQLAEALDRDPDDIRKALKELQAENGAVRVIGWDQAEEQILRVWGVRESALGASLAEAA